MNLVDCYVTKILGEPEYRESGGHGFWCLPVEHDCYGRIGEHTLYFKTEAEARAVTVGHHFLS